MPNLAPTGGSDIEIVLFILLAGVWAALLIPSFISSRREAPISSTESFARSTARLAAVRAASIETVANRERVRARRRRVLVMLAVAALATLAAAIWSGSWTVLTINLIVDASLAAYIGLLLQVKEQARRATLEALQEETTAGDTEVRVVAG